jgi:7-keto-8-aminopelargonate synthetase-like enzyme
LTRPRKKGAAKNRRRLEQKRRLVALGMPEEEVTKLTSRDVLTLLKHPKKVEQAHS